MGPRRLSAARRASPADAADVGDGEAWQRPALGREFHNSDARLRPWVYSTARYPLLIRNNLMRGHERRPCPSLRAPVWSGQRDFWQS